MWLNRKNGKWLLVDGKWLLLAVCCLLLSVAGCREMADQPLHDPLDSSEFFADGMAARPLPPHTVAREEPLNMAFVSGMVDGQPVAQAPLTITADLLVRGQEQYDIYCSPCHGLVGDGDGMIVRRGFPQPPSFHTARLRQMADGAIFDVISSGFGRMYAYGARIKPMDRWAIVAYVRALQFSQQANVADLPPADRQQLDEIGTQP